MEEQVNFSNYNYFVMVTLFLKIKSFNDSSVKKHYVNGKKIQKALT